MIQRILVAIALLFSIQASAQFIIIDPPDRPMPPRMPRPMPVDPGMNFLELRKLKVDTKIKEQVAVTELEEVFYNSTDRVIQGYYFFPIPQGATISKFTMNINGKETPGEILDAAKARQIYEDIVRRSLDPALLEFYDKALLRVRIFPIQPRSEQVIKLTFTQLLPKESNTTEFTFPLSAKSFPSDKEISEVVFRARIETAGTIKNVYSPTNEAEIIRKGSHEATVGFERKNVKPHGDIRVYYQTGEEDLGISWLNFKPENEDAGYFYASISPGLAERAQIQAKDVVFVVDKSGSMNGEKMEQAKKALLFCVEHLNPNDRFDIIPFSTEAEFLFSELKTADGEHVKQAKAFINELRPVGGTAIEESLQKALSLQKGEDRPFFVVFMTDGKPTIGETNEDLLLKAVEKNNKSNVRIFTFGIGTELNTHLLDKLTEMTKAYRSYVLPEESIDLKVADFFTKVSSPVMSDIEVTFDGKDVRVFDIYPKVYADLFKGSSITLMGRFKGEGNVKVNVKGKINGKVQSYSFDLKLENKKNDNQFVADLWAARTVAFLLDQIRLHGEDKELVEEIVRLSKKHGIITPYTSYLILEDEAISLRGGRIQMDEQLLGNRAPAAQAPAMFDDEMVDVRVNSKKEGRAEVLKSTELQGYNTMTNSEAARSGSERLEYKDLAGTKRNLSDGVQNINGRAFYQNNGQWLDAEVQLQASKNLNSVKINFGSDEYFKLIKEKPESRNILALGRNVRFVLDNQEYVIVD